MVRDTLDLKQTYVTRGNEYGYTRWDIDAPGVMIMSYYNGTMNRLLQNIPAAGTDTVLLEPQVDTLLMIHVATS